MGVVGPRRAQGGGPPLRPPLPYSPRCPHCVRRESPPLARRRLQRSRHSGRLERHPSRGGGSEDRHTQGKSRGRHACREIRAASAATQHTTSTCRALTADKDHTSEP
eukprot:2761998-Prymnesium_polylepis.1